MTRAPRYLKILLLMPVLLTLALPIFLGQRDAGPLSPAIPAGIEYTQRRDGEVPWSIHVLRIDRASKELKFETSVANGIILGLSTVSEQARSMDTEEWSPVAAVNGDFFRVEKGPYQGDMLGLQITSGTLISSPSPAGNSFWIDRDGSCHIGQVRSQAQVTWLDDTKTTISAGLNGLRMQGRAVIYTPEFGSRTRTDDDGIELVLESADGPMQPITPSTQMDVRVAKIHEDGDNDVRPGTMVLSIESALAAKLPKPEKGLALRITVNTTPDLSNTVTAIGGWPILVRDGRIVAEPSRREPRTAIGFNDKYFYMVVVDGRQSKLSVGMSFPELAKLMLDLGATQALNLDGGGSSEMWVDGQVVNSPSDGHERPVANALVVLSKDEK